MFLEKILSEKNFTEVGQALTTLLGKTVREKNFDYIEPCILANYTSDLSTKPFQDYHETGKDVLYIGHMTWNGTSAITLNFVIDSTTIFQITKSVYDMNTPLIFQDVTTVNAVGLRYTFVGYKIKLKDFNLDGFAPAQIYAPNPTS